MKYLVFKVALVCLVAGAFGCATSHEKAADYGPTENCFVCKHYNDLACVIVHVQDSTPHAEYEGKTYYFCSEDCRAAFLKNPKKYLPKGS